MSSKLIFQLRKEGKKEEAWNLARKAYRDDPNDDWVGRAYAWTLVDRCKEMVAENNTDAAVEHYRVLQKVCSRLDDGLLSKQLEFLKPKVQKGFQEIHDIEQLSKEGQHKLALAKMETLKQEGKLNPAHHEAYGWVIYRYVKEFADTDDAVELKRKLFSYIQLENERPSLLHSIILNFAISFSKSHVDFNLLSFFKLWGIDKFRSEDLRSSYHEGKNVPSLLSKFANQLVDRKHGKYLEIIQNVYEGQPNDYYSSLSIEEITDVFRQTFFWNIYHISQEKNKDELWQAFDEYLEELSDGTPSEWHSKILSLAERLMDESNDWRFAKFFLAWYPSNLREEDWVKEVKDDHEYPALASKVLKRMYSIASKSDQDFSWLLTVFQSAVEQQSDDIWLRREYAQLLIKYDQLELAIPEYKIIVKELADQYYIWSELALCFERTDAELAASLNAKAVKLQRNEDFLGEIRLKLAGYFESIGKLEMAKYQLECYRENREKHGWKIDESFLVFSSTSWYEQVNPFNDKKLISGLSRKAEELVYHDLPWVTAIVAEVFTNKKGKEYLVLALPNKESIVVKKSKSVDLKSLKEGKSISIRYISKDGNLIPVQFAKCDEKITENFPLGYAYVDGLSDTKAFLVTSDERTLVTNILPSLKVGNFISGNIISYRKKHHDQLMKHESMVNIKTVEVSVAIKSFKPTFAIIDHVNQGKKICHFETGTNKDGLIRFNQLDYQVTEGDVVEIIGYTKTNTKTQKTYFKPILISKSNQQVPHLKKTITGNLELKYKQGGATLDQSDLDNNNNEELKNLQPDFGFIKTDYRESYYVSKELLEYERLNREIEVEVIYTRKGWRVLKIIK